MRRIPKSCRWDNGSLEMIYVLMEKPSRLSVTSVTNGALSLMTAMTKKKSDRYLRRGQ